ncbi:MAG: hypothetical protein ACOX3U_02755 [Christensenellales bacterium]|jgi:hypothetical protein
MGEFFQSLSIFETVLFIFASISSLILLAQIVLVLIGIGHDGDVDIHTDYDDISDTADSDDVSSGAGFSIITFKGIIAFFSVGCWSAFAVSQANGRIVLVIIVGLLAGLASMFGVAYLYKLSFKMQEDGTLNINNAIGQVGKVYLTVPSKGGGSGKVVLTIQERYAELDAITNSQEPIKTDEMVRVIGCYENSLIVEKLDR